MPLPTLSTPTYDLIVPSSGETINYRPFLVREEKILLMALEGKDTSEITKVFQTVLKNCVVSPENFDPASLAMFDLEYVFLQLRARSVGETIEPTIICQPCQKSIQLHIDLSQIEVHINEEHDKHISLTDTVGVVMRYPTINSLVDFNFESDEDGFTDVNSLNTEKTFSTIVNCIDYIYDGEQKYSSEDQTKEELQTFIESLTQGQFLKIQKFFDTMPKLEHTVEYTNPCNDEKQTFVLSTLADFFA